MAWFGSAAKSVVPDGTGPGLGQTLKEKYHGAVPLAPVPLLPVDTTAAASAATVAAAAAAKKQKKLAGAGGDTLLTPPAAGVKPPAFSPPKSLLGS